MFKTQSPHKYSVAAQPFLLLDLLTEFRMTTNTIMCRISEKFIRLDPGRIVPRHFSEMTIVKNQAIAWFFTFFPELFCKAKNEEC